MSSQSPKDKAVAGPDKWKDKDKWIKGLYILLFLVIGYISALLVVLVTVLQFIFNLIFGNPNKNLLDFSKSLTSFLYDIICYLTCISEHKPFPFSPWPSDKK